MHRFSSSRRAQVLIQLAVAALAVLVIFYAATILVDSGIVLALIAAAMVLFALSWMYVRMRRQKDEHLSYHTSHDSITNLPCWSLFVERVDQAPNRTGGEIGSIAVIFLDLDDFKEINHSLGYAAGDKLPVGVSERLKASLRPTDISSPASVETSSQSYWRTFLAKTLWLPR